MGLCEKAIEIYSYTVNMCDLSYEGLLFARVLNLNGIIICIFEKAKDKDIEIRQGLGQDFAPGYSFNII